MRHDIFCDKKSIHVKLAKDAHASLRQKLFKYGLTMQDLFHEAAMMALSDDRKAENLLERISKKKLEENIRRLDKKLQGRSGPTIGELDAETLYNLIDAEKRRSTGDEGDDP